MNFRHQTAYYIQSAFWINKHYQHGEHETRSIHFQKGKVGRECAVVTKLDSFRTSVVRHGGLRSYRGDFLDVAGRIVSLHASWIFFEGLQSVRRWEVRIKKNKRNNDKKFLCPKERAQVLWI